MIRSDMRRSLAEPIARGGSLKQADFADLCAPREVTPTALSPAFTAGLPCISTKPYMGKAMRFALLPLSVGLLCAALQLSCAPPESPPSSKSRASSAAAGEAAAALGTMRGSVVAIAAASGDAGQGPYVGDVPARAASSGNTPCGSSEFSVGPCGGRPASSPSQPDAGSAVPKASDVDTGTRPTTPDDAGHADRPDSAGAQHTLAGLTSEG